MAVALEWNPYRAQVLIRMSDYQDRRETGRLPQLFDPRLCLSDVDCGTHRVHIGTRGRIAGIFWLCLFGYYFVEMSPRMAET